MYVMHALPVGQQALNSLEAGMPVEQIVEILGEPTHD
jgi:hypothetical protein